MNELDQGEQKKRRCIGGTENDDGGNDACMPEDRSREQKKIFEDFRGFGALKELEGFQEVYRQFTYVYPCQEGCVLDVEHKWLRSAPYLGTDPCRGQCRVFTRLFAPSPSSSSSNLIYILYSSNDPPSPL